jgi:hypothetical protein
MRTTHTLDRTRGDSSSTRRLGRRARSLAVAILVGARVLAPGRAGAQGPTRPPDAPARNASPTAVHVSTTVATIGGVSAVSAPAPDRAAGRVGRRAGRLLVMVTSYANAPYTLEVRRQAGGSAAAVRTAGGLYVPLDTVRWIAVARGHAGARNQDVVRLRLTGRAAPRRPPAEAPLQYRVVVARVRR